MKIAGIAYCRDLPPSCKASNLNSLIFSSYQTDYSSPQIWNKVPASKYLFRLLGAFPGIAEFKPSLLLIYLYILFNYSPVNLFHKNIALKND